MRDVHRGYVTRRLVDGHGLVHLRAAYSAPINNTGGEIHLTVCEELMGKFATSGAYFMYDLKPTQKKLVTCVMCWGAP